MWLGKTMTLEELDLTLDSYNLLRKAEITTLGNLIKQLDAEFDEEIWCARIGRSAFIEVLEKIQSIGYPSVRLVDRYINKLRCELNYSPADNLCLEKMANICLWEEIRENLSEIREKKRIKDIVEAFEDFIKASEKIDIIYSEKFGYVWVVDDIFDFSNGRILKAKYLLDNLIDHVAEYILGEKMRTGYQWDMNELISYLENIFETMDETGEFCRGYFAARCRSGALEQELYQRFRDENTYEDVD